MLMVGGLDIKDVLLLPPGTGNPQPSEFRDLSLSKLETLCSLAPCLFQRLPLLKKLDGETVLQGENEEEQ